MLDGLCATIMARSVLESEWDCFVSINSVRLSHERNSQRCDLGDRERERVCLCVCERERKEKHHPRCEQLDGKIVGRNSE